jgi:hypothetical protein
MSISFYQLLNDCSTALGDIMGQTWSRVNVIWPWCIEAMRTFPILRPMLYEYTVSVDNIHCFDLPDDFRELISVEYPVDQSPPQYLIRKNRFDPDFYSADNFYDIDHNYAEGAGWTLHFSSGLSIGDHVNVEYLAGHDLDMADDEQHLITVSDEFYGILIAQVVCRAYRERLSYYMQDPTVHTSIVMQLTEMVRRAEEHYNQMVEAAWQKIATSRQSPRQTMDRFDRVY